MLPKTKNFDVLTWQKANTPKYLILQHMTRDLLVIQASTVAYESAFSFSDKLFSPHCD